MEYRGQHPSPEHFHVEVLACNSLVVKLSFDLAQISLVLRSLLIVEGYEDLNVGQEGVVHRDQYFEEVDLTRVATVHREPDLSKDQDHVLVEVITDHFGYLHVAREAILEDQVIQLSEVFNYEVCLSLLCHGVPRDDSDS